MAYSERPSQSRLKELFTYKDGSLFHKESNGRIKAGERVVTYCWPDGRSQIRVDSRKVSTHVAIYIFHKGEPLGNIVHIDDNKANCRIENLRDLGAIPEKSLPGPNGGIYPSQARLEELFTYREGSLFLRKRRGRHPAGKEVGRYIGPDGYAQCRVDNKVFRTHQIIYILVKGELPEIIDHINGSKSDNRIENLRASCAVSNQWNIGAKGEDGLPKGIHWDKDRGRFCATITINRKVINLGRFKELDEALAAWNAAHDSRVEQAKGNRRRETQEYPTQERLKELFSYDQELGCLRWRQRASSRVHAGDVAGTKKPMPDYKQIKVDGNCYWQHRVIYLFHHGVLPEVVDHIDGDKLNNRIENLQAVSHAQNMEKAPKPLRADGLPKGIRKVENANGQTRFVATISINAKNKRLGTFSTLDEAVQAYEQACEKRRQDHLSPAEQKF